MKNCPSCGYENIDEALFCRNCGHDLNSQKPQKTAESKLSHVKDESIVIKLFYKTDRRTNELRFAKSKSISIAVFILMFLFGIFQGSTTVSFFVVIIVAIVFGLIFAIPVYVLGFITGLLIDRFLN
ncbi:MAG: zinc-ribbon domain-containing protein [Methanobrevibacter sp.]|uniref:zinc-ribbon domain-containing protein n=1 Tax=Methanobrevibacter sp. TaxID=66852 RepID=UPI0025E8F88B|nr:zinc-ribbon domain-containing protein [Methanobrevibacter sp.]MBQ6100159.1 zinc-ribbon domain-containing protein [Methanobrevibacter sp.]